MAEPLSMDQALVKKLTEIVLANLQDENFCVGKLASEIGYSRSTLNRKIKSITKLDSSRFIRGVRLQRAMEMLRNNEGTVSEIAYRVGFSSPAYFTKCFHHQFGCPPGKVKRTDDGQPLGLTYNRFSALWIWTFFRKRVYGFVVTVLFLALIGFTLVSLYLKESRNDKAAIVNGPYRSVAILPFRNLSDNTADQYFYDGIVEEIFKDLSRVHDLRVISRTSTERYKNTVLPVPRIGKELDVTYIVEGAGQKFGNIYRLSVQLIEVSTDRHIWAKSYIEKMKSANDFFKIQGHIARNIASHLNATISRREKILMDKVPTESMAAYKLYLKAGNYRKYFERTQDPISFQTAVNLYEAAIETDTSFARAYSGLAGVYYAKYAIENYFKENYLDSVYFLINKAIEIDEELDEAYYLRGEFYRLRGESDAGLYNYNMALEINPNYYLAYFWKCYLLTRILGD